MFHNYNNYAKAMKFSIKFKLFGIYDEQKSFLKNRFDKSNHTDLNLHRHVWQFDKNNFKKSLNFDSFVFLVTKSENELVLIIGTFTT